MRRFELDGPPRRYWELTVDGRRVRIKWGAVDGSPQVFERTFDTDDAAETYAHRQIVTQVQRGYVEREPPATVAVVAPTVVVERHQRFEWRRENKQVRRFVEVLQEGRKLTVRGGRIVGDHVELDRDTFVVRTFDTAAKASAVFEERCSDARYDGGEPVLPEPPAYTLQCNPELEAQCQEAPGHPAPWAVYADWLIAHGDTRGEIASLALAGKHAEAKRLLGAQLRELCGTEDGMFELEMRHGFAYHATISVDSDAGEPLEDVTRAFLASPIARFVESLRFGLAAHAGDNDWGPTIHAVATSPRAPFIRALRFDHYDHHQSEISWTPFGDFSTAWDKLPALEHLHIKSGAGGTLGTLDLPNLRTFIRESGGLALSEIDAIVAAHWPRLEHLEIWFGSEAYGAEGDLASIRPLLDGTRLPALRHLGIVNCEFIDSVIPALATSRILPQLRSLDLSKGVMARYATAQLVAHADKFRHLTSIDLDANLLLDDELAQIRAVLPTIRAGTQRDRDYNDSDAEELERYCAVGE